MELEEVIEVCTQFIKKEKKSIFTQGYSDEKLFIAGRIRDERDFLIIAAFEGKEFLRYRGKDKNYTYIENKGFETYINSNEFIVKRAKYLLLNS